MVSVTGHFGPGSFRSGHSAPFPFGSSRLGPGSFRSRVVSVPVSFVPGSFRSYVVSVPGHFSPGSFRTGSFRTMSFRSRIIGYICAIYLPTYMNLPIIILCFYFLFYFIFYSLFIYLFIYSFFIKTRFIVRRTFF